jgi:hypothetical protein
MARNKYAEWKASRAGAKKKDDGEATEEQGVLAETEVETDPSMHYPDSTREGKRRSIVPVNRSSMRLFGM